MSWRDKPCIDSGFARSEKGYHKLKYSFYGYTSEHRMVYSKANNYVFKKGDCVLHHCDNPWCSEFTHLFLGTHQDNMQDKVNKNRQAKLKGETNPASYLTEAAVLDIREMKEEGYTQKEIAEEFNISQSQISAIINRNSWGHI